MRDELSGSLMVIAYEHHEVHEGKMFFASYKSPDGSDVADNATVRIQILTGARSCHLTFVCAAGGDAEESFYEGITSTGGTALAAHNMNRRGTMTPSATPSLNPTVSAFGVRLENELLPGGTGGANTPGGVARPGTEWILKTNTKYLVEITNRAGNAQPISIAVEWYEKE